MLLSRPVFLVDERPHSFGVVDGAAPVLFGRLVSALKLDNNPPVFRASIIDVSLSESIGPWIPRLLRASGFSRGFTMPVSRRYSPEHPPGETCLFGFDFSPIIPSSIGLTSGSLSISTNTVPPASSSDFTIGPVQILGRVLYALLSGGISGKDYLLTWTANDEAGNVWPRTAMVLCSATS